MVDKEIIEPDYKNIIENATDYAIMTLDLERRITSWNSGAEKIMGWSREEALGRSGDMIFPVEDRPHVPEEDVRLVREQGSAEDARWHIRSFLRMALYELRQLLTLQTQGEEQHKKNNKRLKSTVQL